jgi:DNA-binding winged helix-turn-helix (wHTH) protein
MPPESSPHLVRFGLFDLDLKTGELRKKGVKIALQEQPFRVLAMLVSRPGELVTREEFQHALWADAVFVDFEHGLNKAVGKVRAALGDLAESPRFIETLERRGYRFVAPVERVAENGVAARAPEPVIHLLWKDRSIALTRGTHLIGRDPICTVWVNSPVASRQHAELVFDGRGLSVHDLGSRNGTYVNSRKVESAQLADGDEVRVGPAHLIVCINADGSTEVE